MNEEVTSHIHYHEYDFNKEHPTLVLQGPFGVAGYNVLSDGTLESTCVCAAHNDSECCCNYVRVSGVPYKVPRDSIK